MTQFLALKMILEKRPCLVADVLSGAVLLTDHGSVAHRLAEYISPQTVVNLRAGLERAARRLGTADRAFCLEELAGLAGISYRLAYDYVVRKTFIVPTIRGFGGSGRGDGCEARFSWLDVYVAWLIVLMKQAGLPSEILRQVQPLLMPLIMEQTANPPVLARPQDSEGAPPVTQLGFSSGETELCHRHR
jgi:hypothetical protein